MAEPIIQPSFAAGELSPSLYGRIDLAKYHSGAALLENFFIDYRGGASNRPGTSYVGRVVDSTSANRLIPFTFSTIQTYALLFGERTMRVIKDGAFVTEPSFPIIAITQANPGVITPTGANFYNGDTVYIPSAGEMTALSGKVYKLLGSTSYTITVAQDATAYSAYISGGTAQANTGPTNGVSFTPSYIITNISQTNPCVITITATAPLVFVGGNYLRINAVSGMTQINGLNLQVTSIAGFATTYGLTDLDGNNVDTRSLPAYTSGGSVARVYTMTTPYAAADLALIKFAQSADTMTLCHPNYQPAQITRTQHYLWTYRPLTFRSSNSPPTNLSAVASSGGSTTYEYVVTSFGSNSATESRPSLPVSVSSVAMSQTAGAKVTIAWSQVQGATLYNVYRTPENEGGDPVPGSLFGYVGSTSGSGASFIDDNIQPNFTATPPLQNDPFNPENISSASIITPGSGYVSPTLAVLDYAGDGAVLGSSINGSGAFNSVTVIETGLGYVNPVVVINDGPGTGATATAVPSGGGISSVSVVAPGAGYNLPVATIVDPTGTGATFSIIKTDGRIVSVTVNNPGSGYANSGVNFPTAVVNDPTGSGATLTPVVASGFITSITINTFGSGYTSPTVTISGPHTSPASASASAETIDGVRSIAVVTSGVNYSNPVVSINDARGTGASFALTIASVQNYPGCTCYYQQRQLFGGSTLYPDTIWMSRTGDYLNMDYSNPSQDDDSIQISLAAQQVNAIKHLVPLTSLLTLTSSGSWKVDGGAQQAAITPTQVEAVPQAYTGCSDVPPIIVNYDVLYVQSKQSTVRDLAYNFYVNIYTGTDVSVLSGHLLKGHQITEWAYADEPYKIIWCVRDDGVMLSFTYLKEQEVYAWARHTTSGLFKSVCSISEGNENAVYTVVQRKINGQYVQYVERLASRDLGGDVAIGVPGDLDKAWFVDAGLQYPLTYPTATLAPAALTADPAITGFTVNDGGSGYVSPTVQITDAQGAGSGATADIFMSGGVITSLALTNAGTGYLEPVITILDSMGSGAAISAIMQRLVSMITSAPIAAYSGDVIRANGGMGTLVAIAGTSLMVDVQKPLTSIWPVTAGNWSCTTPVSTVSGLDHLEGETVSILADGNVMTPQVVSGGSITLDQPASLIVAGLGYRSRFKSLYINAAEQPTDQGKRKKIAAVTMRVLDSRGLKVGQAFDMLEEFKDRTFQTMGQPVQPYTGDIRKVLQSLYDVPGQVCAQMDDPLPVTILALMPEQVTGDSK